MSEPQYKTTDALRGLCALGCGRQDKQLNTYDYLADIEGDGRLHEFLIQSP